VASRLLSRGGGGVLARTLVDVLPGSLLRDPEHVGLLLRDTLNEPVGDFQDWPPWRQLVVAAAR
jgi:hypothetical protein